MNDKQIIIPLANEQDFLLYTTPNGSINIHVLLQDETIWMSQKQMAELFDVNVRTVNEHLKNVFSVGELNEDSVIRNFRITAEDGKKYKTKYYNLDAIISIGYRVNSSQATQFRIWATQILREYIIKGFAIDDDRLKNGRFFDKDFFQELLERVRSIRASERRIYQKITDIFSECCTDYNLDSKKTLNFYTDMQNKFHYAITGKTASEIVYDCADSEKPYMGLTTFKNSPNGRVLKSDTTVAKNYLSEEDIKKLERTVSSFFDYIENLIERRQTFTMEGFSLSVKKFLEFNEFRILEGFGKRTRSQAKEKAHSEYDKFNKQQKIESDFDKSLKKIESQVKAVK
jgi:hypothetical protein